VRQVSGVAVEVTAKVGVIGLGVDEGIREGIG
jgi:hypothetical protein